MTRDYARLATRVARALEQPPGEGRDLALHEARKAAKRTRYAAEAARPALGRPARTFAKRVKAVQKILGDHQDSVVARDALRTLAARAHGAGSPPSPGVCSTGRRKPRRPTGSASCPGSGRGRRSRDCARH